MSSNQHQQQQLQYRMLKTVVDIAEVDNGKIFWMPIDTSAFPFTDYLNFCDRCIDLSTIFCKVMTNNGYFVDAAQQAAAPSNVEKRALLAFEDDIVDMLLNCVAFNAKGTEWSKIATTLLSELPKIFEANGLVPCREWLRDPASGPQRCVLAAPCGERRNHRFGGEGEEEDDDEFLSAAATTSSRRRPRRDTGTTSASTASVVVVPGHLPARAVQSAFTDALQRIASSAASDSLAALFNEKAFSFTSSPELLAQLQFFFQRAAPGTTVENVGQWMTVLLSGALDPQSFSLSLDEIYRQFQLLVVACMSEVRPAFGAEPSRQWKALCELRTKTAQRAFEAASKAATASCGATTSTSSSLSSSVLNAVFLWTTPDLLLEYPPPQEVLAFQKQQQQQQQQQKPEQVDANNNNTSHDDGNIWSRLKVLVAMIVSRSEAETLRHVDFSSSRLKEAVTALCLGSSSSSSSSIVDIEGCLRLLEYRIVRGIAPQSLLDQINRINNKSSSSKGGSQQVNLVDVARAELDRLVNQLASADTDSAKAKNGHALYRESKRFLQQMQHHQ